VAHLAEKLPIVSPLQTGETNGLLALLASAEVKLDIAQQGANHPAGGNSNACPGKPAATNGALTLEVI
jgi:hypothetical protein